MNRRLIRTVENDFPYPIAAEFRILNTEEYLEPDENRLKQLLRTVESTAHFLSIISLVDLTENIIKNPELIIPETFKKEFGGRIVRTSFGKWVALLREVIKVFKINDLTMFVSELADYFIKGKSSESEAQIAFNKVTTIRNKIAHFDSVPTKKDIENFCLETEEFLEIILGELEFIQDYPFLYVNNVNVTYLKWQNPSYVHAFSEVIGNTSKFRAYKKKLKGLVNTPAVILTKENEENYLNLEPFIIFSDEGESTISDIFLYTDWDKTKGVKYRPVWVGGSYSLNGTIFQEERKKSIFRIFSIFGNSQFIDSYKEQISIEV
ncbi:MAG: hypothetical protein JXR68_01510 [Bacteroidales bacterium]|nr:hypothetical protein [Bacteroidales bacterium]